jgi:PAS domain S-box-containing protein
MGAQSRSLSTILCVVAASFPLLAGAGWLFGIPLLTQGHPSLPAMQPNTVVALLLAAGAIVLTRDDWQSGVGSLVSSILATAVLLFGSATLSQYVFGWDLGIDRIFPVFAAGSGLHYPGRPSPQTAANFVLLGVATLSYHLQLMPVRVRQLCAVGVGANAVVAMTGYFFSTVEFYGFPVYEPGIGMAVHTAVSFVLLAGALLCSRPEHGLMTLVFSETLAGRLARRIFLAGVLAPPLLGTLTHMGVLAGWYDVDIQAPLFAVILLGVIVQLTWISTRQADEEERNARAAQDALAVSERKFRGLLESAQDAAVIVNGAGKIEFVNEQAENWFGYARDEMVGQPIEMLVPERLRGLHVAKRSAYLAEPTRRAMGDARVAFRARRKDGGEFPIEIALSPLQSREGLMVTAIVRDMTERVKRETQANFLAAASRLLAESLDYEETLNKIAALAVPEIADGCTLRLSGEVSGLQARAIVHRSRDKQHGLEELVQSLDARRAVPRFLARAARSQQVWLFKSMAAARAFARPEELSDLEALARLGIHAFAIIPLIARGRLAGVLSLFFDESRPTLDDRDGPFLEALGRNVALSLENARLYAQARRAIKAREDVLGIVSHDLNNPLAAIAVGAQLLPRLSTDPTVREVAGRITSSTGWMQRLISDLLNFAKLEGDALALERRPEQLEAALREAIEICEAQAEAKNVRLEADIQPGLPGVFCDVFRIKQVLLNLLGNAIKFTPAGGVVRIAARASGNAIHASVSDTGPGISDADLAMIFERFWQAPAAREAGAGLGLSIAKRIVEAHAGRIWAESRKGEGATFHFTLPAASQPEKAAAALG